MGDIGKARFHHMSNLIVGNGDKSNYTWHENPILQS